MSPNFFKAFGVVTLLVNLIPFCFATEAMLGPVESSWQITRVLILFTAATAVGNGLIHLRKWAAIYFSVPLFIYGIWFAKAAIEEVGFPYNLIWMSEGVSLMLPLIVTIRV
ncbi:MAG TPA: hypothetical protein VF074_00530, partial [Pyrinomonadaceae bacterium]